MHWHRRLASDPENDDLCADGLRVDFTNFTWPTGVKNDRGLNISFTKDIILPPGTSAGGHDGAVVLSFKENKNAYRWERSCCDAHPLVPQRRAPAYTGLLRNISLHAKH